MKTNAIRLGWFVCAGLITVGLVPAGAAAQSELVPAATLRSVSGLADQVWPADFNRDGFPDLAGGWGSVQIALGNGDGTFKPPVPAALDGMVRGVGDMNGDRFVDIIAFSGEGLVVLPGNGNGTFQPARVVGNGWNDFVLVVDLNHDGRRDLALRGADPVSGRLALVVLAGRGDFTFEEPVAVSLLTDFGPAQGTTGDFNGDGLLDIALAPYLPRAGEHPPQHRSAAFHRDDHHYSKLSDRLDVAGSRWRRRSRPGGLLGIRWRLLPRRVRARPDWYGRRDVQPGRDLSHGPRPDLDRDRGLHPRRRCRRRDRQPLVPAHRGLLDLRALQGKAGQ